MSKKQASVLFLGKKNDPYVERALRFCRCNFTDVIAFLGEWGDPLPEDIGFWYGDYIISYLSRWIVPEYLIEKARIAAINFHPAPPEYPGIGCNNFALYEGAESYGVTCHHMASRVDTGRIISTKRFPIFSSDNVASLLLRTYEYQLVLFYEIVGHVLSSNEPLPTSDEDWSRKPFTRKEFNELCRIRPEMSQEEIRKRAKATTFGDWAPTMEVNGFVFKLQSQNIG